MNKKLKRFLCSAVVCVMAFTLLPTGALAEEPEPPVRTEAVLADGLNVLSAGAENMIYTIGEGKVVAATGTAEAPIVFTNCLFNLSGQTMYINGSGVGYSGETRTRLGVGEYVTFKDCTFLVFEGGTSSGSGNDAAIEFFGPGIVLDGSSITGTDWQGQFLGLYGSADVTFQSCTVATTGNTGGWSYAMYGQSVLNLNDSTMTATGMQRKPGGGNVNAFYSGDARTGYDAVNITGSTVDFSDNYGGGFAINNVNIHVKDSTITVNDNAGNACNSGYWIVEDSTIQMNGNKGGHALSCIGFEMTDSTLEILHNGYAGVYVQSRDSSLTSCTVDIRCNGEKLLSYSAGDVWLNTYTLALKDCEHVWLGAVGRKGLVSAENCGYVVAYDLYENKTKGNTEPVLTDLVLSEQDLHTLFLNPGKDFDYARGDTEGKEGGSNDDDLFEDVGKATAIGAETAKIGTLTTAQLSHHKYDWENGTVTDQATANCYGVVKYACTDVCSGHIGWTGQHPDSFDCDGVYVYAPLVGLHFDANAQEDVVTGMPADQLELPYGGTGTTPKQAPVRYDSEDDWNWVFTGWFGDPDCEQPYDFSAALTANWTTVYAGWEKVQVGEGALSISKTVNNGDLNKEFTFTVTLKDASGEELAGEFTYTGSKTGMISSGGTVELSNGQTVAINHLPVGAFYTVTETPVSNYTVAISGHDATEPYYGNTAEGTILSGSAAVVHYTNTYYYTPVNPDPPVTPNPPVTPTDPGKPTLNTADHVAYIIGYVDGSVRPLSDIKRSEVATIFFRLLTDESRAHYWSQSNPYSDVDAEDWYNNAISTLTNAGVITGYPDGTFRPDEPISRSEFAAIAARFSDVVYDGGNSFTDVPSSHWAARYIALAEHLGWINGYPDGSFKPDQAITRAEAMTLVNRVLERAVEEDHMLSGMVAWDDNQPGTWYYEAVQEATNSHTYVRLTKTVPGQDFCYEDWQKVLKVPDWAGLERVWSTANSK